MRRLAICALVLGGCYDVDDLAARFGGSDGGTAPADLAAGTGAASWHPVAMPGQQDLRGVWASATDVFTVGAGSRVVDVTAVGEQAAVDTVPPGFDLRAVAGANTVFAVGDTGAVLTRAGGQWSGYSLSDETLYGVWAAGDADAWAVGTAGTVVHYGATGWTVSDAADVTVVLRGVWSQGGDLFAVGSGGYLAHGAVAGTGTVTWTVVGTGTTQDLFAVFGDGTNLYAAGAGGLILRSGDGGATFAPEVNGSNATLYAISGAGGEVFAAGDAGTIVHRTGTAWRVEHSGGPTLRSIWAVGAEDVWAAGDGGTLLHLRR